MTDNVLKTAVEALSANMPDRVLESIYAGHDVVRHLREVPEYDPAPCYPGDFAMFGVPVFESSALDPDDVVLRYINPATNGLVLRCLKVLQPSGCETSIPGLPNTNE